MENYSEDAAMLIAQTGPLNGQRWALRRSFLVGRDATCDIVVADRQVSRHHARFNLTSQGIELEDLSSKNGTHINGRQIFNKIVLQDGDVVQIALAQKFVYLSSDSTVPLEPQEAETGMIGPDTEASQIPGGALRLDKRSRQVWVREVEIVPPLSVSQFRLLELLYDNQGRVVPRSDLILAVWEKKHAYEVSEQALDALVRRLRDRIADIDAGHMYIITVRGHGLRLDNPRD
jgi:hypothetical protein